MIEKWKFNYNLLHYVLFLRTLSQHYQPLKITSPILELQILLLCDQRYVLAHKEYISNSTKGNTMIIESMITYP